MRANNLTARRSLRYRWMITRSFRLRSTGRRCMGRSSRRKNSRRLLIQQVYRRIGGKSQLGAKNKQGKNSNRLDKNSNGRRNSEGWRKSKSKKRFEGITRIWDASNNRLSANNKESLNSADRLLFGNKNRISRSLGNSMTLKSSRRINSQRIGMEFRNRVRSHWYKRMLVVRISPSHSIWLKRIASSSISHLTWIRPIKNKKLRASTQESIRVRATVKNDICFFKYIINRTIEVSKKQGKSI